MGRIFAVACGLLTAILCHAPASAIEPEQREVVVISARVWEGYEYREVFIPSTHDEMVVVADQPSAISFVRTLEYYWPLSRRVYVDFQRQRDVLDGDLVIRQNGIEVSRRPLGVFSILYPDGAAKGSGELLWDEEARAAYADYQEQESQFIRDHAAARRAHTAYERQLLEAGTRRREGEAPVEIAPPPPLPEPSLRLVTAPAPGFALALDPGTYTIVLEREGRAVAGTERRVRAIGLAGTETLVADIVPSERWTRPLASNTPAARIYARPGAVLYLTLAEASRFDEADYLPVINPQAEPMAGRSVWVRRHPAEVANLAIVWGQSAEALERGPLKVDQTRGSGFGYTVRAAREGETADLDAFSISVPARPSVNRGIIADIARDEPFVRQVVIVHERHGALGLGLALLPLAGFAAFFVWRRIRPRGMAES